MLGSSLLPLLGYYPPHPVAEVTTVLPSFAVASLHLLLNFTWPGSDSTCRLVSAGSTPGKSGRLVGFLHFLEGLVLLGEGLRETAQKPHCVRLHGHQCPHVHGQGQPVTGL